MLAAFSFCVFAIVSAQRENVCANSQFSVTNGHRRLNRQCLIVAQSCAVLAVTSHRNFQI